MGKRRNTKMEPYVLNDIALEKFVNGGQALGYTTDGKPVFVWGALAGETVDVLVSKAKKGILEGVAEKVKVKSPNRIEPLEQEEYMSTSPWQILSYGYENEVKLSLLRQTFKHEAGIDFADTEMAQGKKEYGYRNKMEYNFWGDDEGVHLALHKRGTGQKIKLSGSALASEAINKAGKELVSFLNLNKIFAGDLKSIVLRSNRVGECVGALFVKKEKFGEFEAPKSLKGLVCYYSNPKSPASVKTSEIWRIGDITLSDEVCGTALEYDVDSFFQVNIEIFEKAIEDIRTKLNPKTKKVIDFYGGVGSIGVLVADGRALEIVDIDKDNAQMAKQNLAKLKLDNAEVVCLPGEDSLDSIVTDSTLIVDPPRAGLHKRVVQQIAEVKPKQVIYLSCNPVTQARDVKILVEAGYKISFAKGYNFFPRTPHIESLVILEC
ncbi:MAG: Class SAM-dependent methyltransferase [Patescibacteria group bacterium]|nr:Class SAM-dependent methyltransferase [Patescibacteria group bacterium]